MLGMSNMRDQSLRTFQRDTGEAIGRVRDAARRLARAAVGRPDPLAGYIGWELGDDALAVDAHPSPD